MANHTILHYAERPDHVYTHKHLFLYCLTYKLNSSTIKHSTHRTSCRSFHYSTNVWQSKMSRQADLHFLTGCTQLIILVVTPTEHFSFVCKQRRTSLYSVWTNTTVSDILCGGLRRQFSQPGALTPSLCSKHWRSHGVLELLEERQTCHFR